MFRGVYEPVASYAAAGWRDRLDSHDLRRLNVAQRIALLTVTGAYRTASHDALCAIAGVLPVRMLLDERQARYKIRIGKTVEIGTIVVDSNNPRKDENDKVIPPVKDIKDETRRLWREYFKIAPNGRNAFAFFPDILKRLDAKWIITDHWISQVLTGHGQFLTYLHRVRGHEYTSTDCECGTGEDNVEHFLLKCPTFAAQRECIAEFIGARRWPEAAKALVATKEAFEAFAAFCRECMWLKYASAKCGMDEAE